MTDLLLSLSPAGRALLAWALRTNGYALLLLVAARVLDRLLTRRVSASWRIMLYAPIVVQIALPRGSLSVALRSSAPLPTRVESLLDAPIGADLGTTGHHAASLQGAIPLLVYVLVACGLAILWGTTRHSLASELTRARPIDLGPRLRVPYPTVVHAHLGPLVAGIFRPCIVLPAQVAEGDEDTLEIVLAHELAHIRRGDPLLLAVMQWLTIALWPIVAAWIAARRVEQLVEIASDERALVVAGQDERRRYGHTLLDMAQWRMDLLPSRAALHFKESLRARIEALAHPARWRPVAQQSIAWLTVVGLATCSRVSLAARVDADGFTGWAMDGAGSSVYSADLDTPVLRDGNATTALHPIAETHGLYGTYMTELDAAPYRGRRVHAAVWIRTDGVTKRGDFWMRVQAAGSPPDGPGLGIATRTLPGTSDFARYELTLDVADEAAALDVGVGIAGPGRLWIEGYELTVE